MTTQTQPQAAPQATVQALEKLLANTYILALKTQNYHWNVTGPHFNDLHAVFETQYDALAEAVDLVAERIRALGAPTPGSFKAFLAAADIPEAEGGESAADMVLRLAQGHEAAARSAKAVIAAAEAADDPVTADLATVRAADHDKTAWMLRATAAR